MKVTFLAPEASLSGGARVISIYARELSKRGVDVKVILPRGRKLTWRGVLRQVRRGDLRFGHVWVPSHYDAIEHLVHRLERRGPIEERDCPDADIVIATWWETAAWMMPMSATKGRKVHFVQGYEGFNDWMKPRVDAILKADTKKITISHWLSNILVDKFGARDVTLVPNGVDLDQFKAAPRGRQPQPTVGMLYHHGAFKNTPNGIAAFNLLAKRFPQAKLVVFGEHDVIDTMPLPANAEFHQSPAQDRIKDIYASCDVWVCSSDEEGFHLPMLEAMACRCPVISTPVGGPKDVIVEGVNGHLVPKRDPQALAAKLIDFFEQDGAGWQRMSDAAYATAVNRDWQRSVDLFQDALQDVLTNERV